MRPFGGIAAALVLTLAACSTGTVRPAPTTQFDPIDPRPLLTLTNSGCMLSNCAPIDMATIALYPDGTMIRIEVTPGASDTPTPTSQTLVATTYQLDDAEVARLFGLARTAGLGSATRSGPLPFIPLPGDFRMADEGADIIVLRTGDVLTSQAIDGVGLVAPPGPDDNEPRRSYAAIHTGLWQHVEHDTPTGRVPVERWVVIADSTHRALLTSSTAPWSGPAPSTFTWTQIDSHTKCAIVTATNWPITGPPDLIPSYVQDLDGQPVERRPLLAHEHTCADVAAIRAALGM